MHSKDSCCEINDYASYCTYTYHKVYGFVDFCRCYATSSSLITSNMLPSFISTNFTVYVITNLKMFLLSLVSSFKLRLYAL